jgi:tetratricopeptide (TPR) repeat protein
MDGRKSLVLALGLITGGLGCVGSSSFTRPSEDLSKTQTATADQGGPKDKPRASTWVAFGDFKESLAVNPELPQATRQTERVAAIRAYQKALETDPKCLRAYAGLARLYGSAGEHGQALEACQKALKIQPKDASIWFEMGMCFARQKQWDKAVANLRTAARLDPANRRYVSSLAFCLARLGQYNESLALFTRVAGKAVANYEVARMAHHLRQDELCKELLRAALKEKPDYDEARGMLQQLEGRADAEQVVKAGLAAMAK